MLNNRYKVVQRDGVRMKAHRVVWADAYGPIPPGMEVDHINGDTFDNRLENLRLADRYQQNANSAPRLGRRYKGVSLRRRDRWIAQIQWRGHKMSLGTYDTEEAAAKAYNIAARLFFGEFARLNEVDEMSDNQCKWCVIITLFLLSVGVGAGLSRVFYQALDEGANRGDPNLIIEE